MLNMHKWGINLSCVVLHIHMLYKTKTCSYSMYMHVGPLEHVQNLSLHEIVTRL